MFFLALAMPTGVLIWHAYGQLKWEAFHQHRMLAEELVARIDSRLSRLITEEEARSFTDYGFLVVIGDPSANFVQRSPLSVFPSAPAIPGLIGYFQVDAQGAFTTPLLPGPQVVPAAYGISAEELALRLGRQQRIQAILSRNRLVQVGEGNRALYGIAPLASAPRRDMPLAQEAAVGTADKDLAETESDDHLAPASPEEEVRGQVVFDRLNELPALRERKKQRLATPLGRVEDLKLESRYATDSVDQLQRQAAPLKSDLLQKRAARKERSALPEPPGVGRGSGLGVSVPPPVLISTFESEIDPLEFSLLDSGHFVLFRKVWRDGTRYVQGALIEQQPFLSGVIESAFQGTALSRMSELIVAYRGNVFSAFTGQRSGRHRYRAEDLGGALLYRTRLSTPLSEMELIFSITRLPAGPGGTVINWVAAILSVVLCGGFYLMYRLGVGQIELARQQQDFVSAVSHELKTPLTSIRMYGEMLREGWASEEKKKTYYEYIHDESERLSRLITNVLQLARMTRNDLRLDLKPRSVAELVDGIRSKIGSQIERAGFALDLDCDAEAGQAVIRVDADAFTQIVINLADNAIKFSAGAEVRRIDITCRLHRRRTVVFSVRDHGPGVARDQMEKIFRLFYRSENELTRETVGTGIGLALVHQLALAMGGQVDVLNREPGAEFRVSYPAVNSGAS